MADKGITNAVRCSQCNNLTAFDDGDINWIVRIEEKGIVEWGYIQCPWCGKQMFVGERQESAVGKMMVRKYHTTIEGVKYEEDVLCYQTRRES